MSRETRNSGKSPQPQAIQYGIATIVYRATGAPGELDMWGGPGTGTGAVDGPDGNTGNRTLTVSLDFTPTGGYDGTSNFGKVTWSDSALGTLGSYTYAAARNFGSILVTDSLNSGGTISGLSLSQVPEPSTAILLGLGGLGLILLRRRS